MFRYNKTEKILTREKREKKNDVEIVIGIIHSHIFLQLVGYSLNAGQSSSRQSIKNSDDLPILLSTRKCPPTHPSFAQSFL